MQELNPLIDLDEVLTLIKGAQLSQCDRRKRISGSEQGKIEYKLYSKFG